MKLIKVNTDRGYDTSVEEISENKNVSYHIPSYTDIVKKHKKSSHLSPKRLH